MMRELRFIAGVPFGFMSELFARMAILISGNQLNVDFNYIGQRWFRDACELCHGARGGVPGNENIIDGKVMCDYCSADRLRAPNAGIHRAAEGRPVE